MPHLYKSKECVDASARRYALLGHWHKTWFLSQQCFFTLVPGIYPGVERQIHFQRVTLPLNRARSRLINAASAKDHTHTQSAGRKINPSPCISLISPNLSYPEPSNSCGGARCCLTGQTWERARWSMARPPLLSVWGELDNWQSREMSGFLPRSQRD